MSARSLIKLLRTSLLVGLAQFAFVTLAHGQTTITLDGYVQYSTGQPAVGATVTMSKNTYMDSPPIVTTQTTTVGSDGHYAFTAEARCGVEYSFQASSSQPIDDELQHSGTTSISGCVLGNSTLGTLQMNQPQPITLGGYVTDQFGAAVEGLTVTMTRTKYDLNPNVITTATTTTDGGGHYQFSTYSRCSVVEEFHASIGNYVFAGSDSISGCVLGSYDNLNFSITVGALGNAGQTSCNTGIGRPVNVTNGNVYLQQTDFQLPGVGEAIAVRRSYNSISPNIRLFGRGWTTIYDEYVSTNGNQLELTMPDGRIVSALTPDFFGQILHNGDGSYSVTFKDGSVHQFNSSGQLVSLADRNGNHTVLAYSSGRLSSITDAFGRLVTVTTNSDGRVLSLSDSTGTIATYTYGSANELLSVTYPDNSAYHFSYVAGPAGLILSALTDGLGNIVERHDYDSQGRATSSEAQNGVEHYTLNYVNAGETDVTDALGRLTKYFYHSIRGRKVVARVEGLCSCGSSQTQQWTYDTQVNATSKTDALNHTTSYTYDANGNVLTKTDTLGTSTYTYNSFAEVLTASDPMGVITSNTYDSYGNLLSVTNAEGSTTSFTYNTRGQMLTATDALLHRTDFTYDTSGNLTQKKDALNNITQFAYDARGRMTSTTNALNQTISYQYDAMGRGTKVTQPDSSFVTSTYDLAGRRTQVSDARNSLAPTPTPTPTPLVDTIADWSKTFSHTSNFVIEGTDWAQLFNGDSTRAGRSDGNSGSVVWNYSGVGSFEMITYHDSYFSYSNPTLETSADGATWTTISATVTSDGGSDPYWPRHFYRASGLNNVNYVRATFAGTGAGNGWTVKLTQMTLTAAPLPSLTLVDTIADWTHTASHSSNFVIEGSGYASLFNGDDNRASRNDGNEGSVVWNYPRLQSFEMISYHDSYYAYNEPTFQTSADGVSWATISATKTSDGGSDTYWPRHFYRAANLTNANYIRVAFPGTGAGNGWTVKLTQMTLTAPIASADGYNPTSYGYDGANRLVSVSDAAGHTTTYGYDAMSNLTSMTDALSRVTNYQYDDFNRLAKTTYPPATTGATRLFESVEYDAAGNVTKRTDTAGRSTTYLYDAANRPTRATDPLLEPTNFEYNARSQTTAVVDALNQRYEFAYDSLGRVTQNTRAGVSMSYAYDGVGNRTQRTDYNGVVTNYAYDALNRLTTITYPSNQTTGYVYDALSRLISATNVNGTVALNYDNRGRVASTTDVFNQTVGYSYDANGNRLGMSLNGSTYAGYAYDVVNRLTNLADSANLTFNYNYDAANRLSSRSAPNGVTTSYAYDGLDRLTTVTHAKGATTLINNQYTYNDANNISSWTNASGSHAYTYDAVDRLTSATNSTQSNETYSYDGVGNRTASNLSASYSYQSFNRLTSTASATYSYDNNGNLISKTDASGTTTLNYDEENRLKQVSLPRGLVVNYKYDAFARRILRTTSTSANERYIYDGQDALIDLNGDSSVTTTYLNDLGIDNHLRQTSATTGVSYFLTDHLGSRAAFTDASGNILEQSNYDSFGNNAGSTRTRYGYTGRERDPDTGLLYYRARFYDSEVGRFSSEDPIGFGGGDVNLYPYVMSDPVNNSDESGLQGRAGPKGRGNYHPPFRVRCNASQDCDTLARNMAEIARALASAYMLDQELGFPRHQPPYSTDIPDWANAFARCKQIYDRKCKNCGPGSPVPVPNPARVRHPNGPTMDELRMQIEAARHMEIVWGTILGGSVIGGAAVVGGPPAAAWLLRLLAGGGGILVFQH